MRYFKNSPCQTSWVVNPFGAYVFSQAESAEFLTAQRHLPPTPVARPVSAEPLGFAMAARIFGKIHMAGYKVPILVVEKIFHVCSNISKNSICGFADSFLKNSDSMDVPGLWKIKLERSTFGRDSATRRQHRRRKRCSWYWISSLGRAGNNWPQPLSHVAWLAHQACVDLLGNEPGAVWLYGWVVLEKELQSSIVICFERLRFEGFAGPRVATWWVNRCLPKEKAGSSPLPNQLKIDTVLAGKGWINFLHWDMSIYKYIHQWTSILYCMYAVHMFICTYYILIMCISCMYIYYMYITLLQFHRTTSSPHHFLPDHVCWVSPTTSGSSTKAKAAKAQATLKSKPPKHPTAQKFPRLYHWGIRPFRGTAQRHVQGVVFCFITKSQKYYWVLSDSIEVTA